MFPNGNVAHVAEKHQKLIFSLKLPSGNFARSDELTIGGFIADY